MQRATQRLAKLSLAKKSICGHFDVPDMELGAQPDSPSRSPAKTRTTEHSARQISLDLCRNLSPSPEELIPEALKEATSMQEAGHGGSSFFRRNGASFFHREVVKILEDSPEESCVEKCVEKCKAFGIPALMLTVFVSMSSLDPMVKSASKQRIQEGEARDFRYDPGSVICVASFISIFIGNGMSFAHSRMAGVRRIWNPQKLLRMCIPSTLFTLAQILKFISLKYLPVDVVVLLDQSSLVFLAITMRLFLKKIYTPSQWCLLTITAGAMIQYMMLKDEGKTREVNHDLSDLAEGWLVGLAVMVSQVMISVAAAVLCEKLLKGGYSDDEPAPFWEQKAQLECSGCIVALLWCYTLGPYLFDNNLVKENGFFCGWDGMTVLVLCVTLGKLWLSGLIAKLLDSVVKQLGSCAAMLVTYFLQLSLPSPWGNRGHNGGFTMNTMVSMLIVGLSVSSFAISSEDARRVGREMKKIEGITELSKTISDRRNTDHSTS